MTSVTQRVKQVTQPRGGYLKPSEFEKIEFTDKEVLKEENISSSLVGLVVDYLTRFMLDAPLEEAFKISLLGARIIGEEKKAHQLLDFIKGLDDASIGYACKLVGYDVCYRSGPIGYKDVDDINADANTIHNIKIMVQRSILFFKSYGPIIRDGFTFDGGYTDIITNGDGDFLTFDTLWDFKVSRNSPTSDHTLQLLIYYIMGTHSIHKEFQSISKLGIFNPRLNCAYLKNISAISQEVIDEVSRKVIGYSEGSRRSPLPSENALPKQPDMLSMAEIMKALSCSRYMVMKYYSEYGLPLVKKNNKYFIREDDLLDWAEQMEKKRRRQQILSFFIVLVLLVVLFIYMAVIMEEVRNG